MNPNIGQMTTLFCIIEAISDYKLASDFFTDVVNRQRLFVSLRFTQQGSNSKTFRLKYAERFFSIL